MTKPQIDKAVSNYRAMLEKHLGELPSEAVQTVLGQLEFAREQLDVFRKRVDDEVGMIVRPFKIDRTKTPQQLVDSVMSAKGRVCHVWSDILATMPTDGPDEGEMYFFRHRWDVSCEEQTTLLAKRGLIPHHLAQLQINIDDASFAPTYPNATQWRHDNKYFGASFGIWKHTYSSADGHNVISVAKRMYPYFWEKKYYYGGIRT